MVSFHKILIDQSNNSNIINLKSDRFFFSHASHNKFMKFLLRILHVDYVIYIMACIYLSRFTKYTGIKLTNTNVYTMILGSVLLSVKIQDDEAIYLNRNLSRAMKMPVSKLNLIESNFLNSIRFDTYIHHTHFDIMTIVMMRKDTDMNKSFDKRIDKCPYI